MVSQNTLNVCGVKLVFIEFAAAVDLNKCHEQIKLPISELPSHTSTMESRIDFIIFPLLFIINRMDNGTSFYLRIKW